MALRDCADEGDTRAFANGSRPQRNRRSSREAECIERPKVKALGVQPEPSPYRRSNDRVGRVVSDSIDRSRVSNRLQVLDQILLLFRRQVQIEVVVVVLEDIRQSCKATVVVEATFVNLVLVEQRSQRSRHVALAWA